MTGIMGAMMPVAFNFAPRAWMSCEGQLLAINSNTALFSLLGTTYGGDGRTTFGLPDMRGRIAVGQGTGPGLQPIQLGQKAGVMNVSLNVLQLPSHTHAVTTKANAFSATSSDPSNNYFGGSGPNIYDPATDNTLMNPACISAAIAGNGIPVNIQNPYVGMYYLICIQGIFPSRN